MDQAPKKTPKFKYTLIHTSEYKNIDLSSYTIYIPHRREIILPRRIYPAKPPSTKSKFYDVIVLRTINYIHNELP